MFLGRLSIDDLSVYHLTVWFKSNDCRLFPCNFLPISWWNACCVVRCCCCCCFPLFTGLKKTPAHYSHHIQPSFEVGSPEQNFFGFSGLQNFRSRRATDPLRPFRSCAGDFKGKGCIRALKVRPHWPGRRHEIIEREDGTGVSFNGKLWKLMFFPRDTTSCVLKALWCGTRQPKPKIKREYCWNFWLQSAVKASLFYRNVINSINWPKTVWFRPISILDQKSLWIVLSNGLNSVAEQM